MGKKSATKKNESKKVESQKIDTKVDEKEVRSAWLKSYVSKKDTAAKLCTLALQKGATLSELKKICQDYSKTHPKPDGTQQKWGTSKNSDLTQHCSWLKNKGYNVSVSDSGKYTVTV